MAIKDVREWTIYHSLRLWMNQTLEFECYEVDIPNKWLFHSEKKRNNNILYTLKKLDSKENKYVFASIIADYDNQLADNLKVKAKVISFFEDTEYTGYQLGNGDENGNTSYFVKLDKKPFFIMSNQKNRVVDLLKDFTQSKQNPIKFTCED